MKRGIATLLEELSVLDEHERIEAKTNTSGDPGNSVNATISAFSNEPGLGGGYIVFGVTRVDEKWELDDDEKFTLVHVRENGRVTNAELRDFTGDDTLAASRKLRRMAGRRLLEMRDRGPAAYYVAGENFPPESSLAELPLFTGETASIVADPTKQPTKRPTKQPTKHPTKHPTKLSETGNRQDFELFTAVEEARQRRDPALARRVILEVCAAEPQSAEELAELLGRNRRYVLNEYVTPLLQEGRLHRTHPQNPRHPGQKYWATATIDEREEE